MVYQCVGGVLGCRWCIRVEVVHKCVGGVLVCRWCIRVQLCN